MSKKITMSFACASAKALELLRATTDAEIKADYESYMAGIRCAAPNSEDSL